jgi:hypothetical protein
VTWVGWRLQRTETLIAAAILALLAALLIPTGIEMAHAYEHGGLASCVGQNSGGVCGGAIQSFNSRFQTIAGLTAWFTLVPGLIGVLLAAPYVLELENGTCRLVWTQSITRGRWIATKLGVTISAAVLAAGAMTLLITWWRIPLVHLNGRMGNGVFDFEGTVALGYALFALGLALALGVVWRRTVPALIVAFMGYVAARIFVETWLRMRYVKPLTATWREFVPGVGGKPRAVDLPASLEHAWVISQYPSDKLGRRLEFTLGSCVPSNLHGSAVRCIAPHGVAYSHAVFQPGNRFWLFQGIETAIFGGIAVVLIAFAAWWTRRRNA